MFKIYSLGVMFALLGAPVTAEDCSRPTPGTGAYLLWQAPGGFAGWGPAVEVRDSGAMNLWQQTHALEPHQVTASDVQIQLSSQEIDELFLLLAQVDFSSLPHPTDIWVECAQTLYLEPCSECEPIVLQYQLPDQLRPEMNEVFAWFEDKLGDQAIPSPAEFCAEMVPPDHR